MISRNCRNTSDDLPLQDNEPTVRQVKSALQAPSSRRSLAKGLAVFALVTTLYLSTLAAVWIVTSIAVKIVIAAFLGCVLAMLFVAAHDACHGALTPNARLNRVIGRLLFAPTWHPYAAWEHAHNGLHHGYTNVRGIDPVFPPLALAEFNALTPAGRLGEQAMRSPIGVIGLYFYKVWLPIEAFPGKRTGLKGSTALWFQFDRACCVAFAGLQVAASFVIARWTGQSAAVLIVVGVCLPVTILFYLLAWAVHLHHTHPSVPWYASKNEWSYFRGQVRGSVHMEFPRPIELFILNIMDHTAHHADPRIPLYDLHDAQKRIETTYPADIIHEPFTFQGWLRLFRICRLYDYTNHRWLDWDGTPLTPPLLQPRGSNAAAATMVETT